MQQYDSAKKVRVVNALCANEGQYGYGPISSYLRREGAPRSTAYAWKKRFQWLVLCGSMAISRLEREASELQAENETLRRGCERRQAADRDREHRFILEAACPRTGDEPPATEATRPRTPRRLPPPCRGPQRTARTPRAPWLPPLEYADAPSDEISLSPTPLPLTRHCLWI